MQNTSSTAQYSAEQYARPEKLNIRIAIHQKYSTNPQPYGEWIAAQYRIAPGAQVLELGCGTGEFWRGRLSLLAGDAQLTLTDLSAGMVETARAAVGEGIAGRHRVQYRVADIQSIPYPDASFDVVIANSMLYHVPDLPRALAEVRRVLRPGGSFYCATFGEQGVAEYVSEILEQFGLQNPITHAFTLQNGGAQLRRQFEQVECLIRPDSLAITAPEDFADYIQSLPALQHKPKLPHAALLALLRGRMQNGVLTVPKQYGMFICR